MRTLMEGALAVHTSKRLSDVHSRSPVIRIGASARIVFMSDLHRGDNSMADEFAHNQSLYYHALEYYDKEGYSYVEAGDGDELWEHSKFSVIREAHSDVYMKLSELYAKNRLYMLYGNHNIFLKRPNYVRRTLYQYLDMYWDQIAPLFPGIQVHEGIRFLVEPDELEIFVVHGHQGDFGNDQAWPFAMLMLRYFWRFMHIIGFRNPASPAKNRFKQHRIERSFSRWIQKNRTLVICGHTHRPKFPQAGELPYLNTGCGVHPRGLTAIELLDGKLMMVDWRIRPDNDGVLRIERKIIRGPLSLQELYDCPGFQEI